MHLYPTYTICVFSGLENTLGLVCVVILMTASLAIAKLDFTSLFTKVRVSGPGRWYAGSFGL